MDSQLTHKADGVVMADDRNVTAGRDILPHHQKMLLHSVSIVCAMVIAPSPETFLVYCMVCAMDLKPYRSMSLNVFFNFLQD